MDFRNNLKPSKLDLEFPLSTLKKNMGGKEYSFYDTASQFTRSFPISICLMVMSGVFWILVFVLVYQAISLFSLYNAISDETDLEVKCDSAFDSKSSVNFDKVMHYPRGSAGPYLVRFKPERSSVVQQTTGDQFPPFVTAVTTVTFFAVQGLIKQFRKDVPELKRVKLIIYDLGLHSRERELMDKYCDCEVRTFTKSAFPDHVSDVTLNAWKPIIIQLVIDEYGSAIYMNPDMRLKSVTSLNILKNRGDRDFFVWDADRDETTPKSLIGYTYPETFMFLKESRCAFRDSGMVATDVIVMFRSNTSWQLVMKPWLICALNKECIAPSGARTKFCFHVRRPKTTGCHMFDQSAISIPLNRAFQITINRDKFVPQKIAYHAEEMDLYFIEQPWTNTQFFVIIIIVVLLFAIYPLLKSRRRIPFKIL